MTFVKIAFGISQSNAGMPPARLKSFLNPFRQALALLRQKLFCAQFFVCAVFSQGFGKFQIGSCLEFGWVCEWPSTGFAQPFSFHIPSFVMKNFETGRTKIGREPLAGQRLWSLFGEVKKAVK
jgi:hypothetical protein